MNLNYRQAHRKSLASGFCDLMVAHGVLPAKDARELGKAFEDVVLEGAGQVVTGNRGPLGEQRDAICLARAFLLGMSNRGEGNTAMVNWILLRYPEWSDLANDIIVTRLWLARNREVIA